jgi:hypothetical protein
VATDLSFACRCNSVTGVILDAGPRQGDHVVCHCSDCQDLIRYLGHPDLLDSQGGTALYQSRCARMQLTSGKDKLACLHLTEKPTLRWYAQCCRAPLFNTYANGKVPYLTTHLSACERGLSDRVLGPPRGHLFLEEARGESDSLPRLAFSKLMLRFFLRMIPDLLSGDRRRSELFDPITLAPIAEPSRLTAEERAGGFGVEPER